MTPYDIVNKPLRNMFNEETGKRQVALSKSPIGYVHINISPLSQKDFEESVLYFYYQLITRHGYDSRQRNAKANVTWFRVRYLACLYAKLLLIWNDEDWIRGAATIKSFSLRIIMKLWYWQQAFRIYIQTDRSQLIPSDQSLTYIRCERTSIVLTTVQDKLQLQNWNIEWRDREYGHEIIIYSLPMVYTYISPLPHRRKGERLYIQNSRQRLSIYSVMLRSMWSSSVCCVHRAGTLQNYIARQ